MEEQASTVPTQDAPPRRPIAMRSQGWVQTFARQLTGAGIAPNTISLSGLVFAVLAGCALWASGSTTGVAHALLLVAAAAGIQLRLLCNMMDGMVAIEGGKRTPYGEIYNDMPDRFADSAILAGAGYSLVAYPWGPQLGLLAALLAVLTAYVRLLGGSMKTKQYFVGPMAKPHRMGTMTAAAFLTLFEPLVGLHGQVIAVALGIVVVGSAYTFFRRTRLIVAEIGSR